jgi:RNA polymerase sigma-70 factor, ECF subfamily
VDERDDATLLRAVRDGDAEALEALLARHEDRIFRFGMRMCRHEEDARDVVQETMLAVARSAERFRGDASFAGWLFSIARNACAKNRRKRVGQPETLEPLDTAEPLPSESEVPEQILERRRMEQALEAAIASLRPKHREVVLLRDVEGLSAKEVAQATGSSVAAVKSRLHRARAELREMLQSQFGAESHEPHSETCPDVLAAWSERAEGDLEPSACAQLEQHVASCPRCAARCDGLRAVLAGCADMPGPRVPASVEAAIRAALLDALRP